LRTHKYAPLAATKRQRVDAPNRGLIPLAHPHKLFMTTWTKTFTREPPKTKAQLREMLTEAVRNTQPEPKRPPKAKKDRG
jgi:hypothetical protein